MQINGLSFRYRRSSLLFDGLDLELKRGSIYGLLGKNGAGKTTLLKLMTGLLYGDGCRILFGGQDISERHPIALKEVFILPEEFHLPEFTSSRYIDLYSPFWDQFNRDQMEEYLEEFEVDSRQRLKHMSYGQQKKFLIAFALATNCSLILMDEPTNGLDIPSKSKFRKVVASTLDAHRSIVISTHQVRDLEHLIDPVIVIDQGRIVLHASIDSIARGLLFCHAGTEKPATGEVLYSEPAFGGVHTVHKNETGDSGPLDFELLFNAITQETDRVSAHINTISP